MAFCVFSSIRFLARVPISIILFFTRTGGGVPSKWSHINSVVFVESNKSSEVLKLDASSRALIVGFLINNRY